MKKTNLVLAITSVLALSACGGGGGGGSASTGGTANKTTITVIDGYLGNAEIYADVNADGVADASELQGKTEVDGKYELDNDMLTYDIIAKAIAGQTMDDDKFGELATGFEFIAPAGELYVTPFSTLAVKNGAAVDYPAGYVVSGDYIASGDKKAHALARTLTAKLAGGDTAEAITSEIEQITTAIDTAEAEGKDLDTIQLSTDGNYTVTEVLAAKEYLNGETFYVSSTNQQYYAGEGVEEITYNDDFVYTNTGFEVPEGGEDTLLYGSDNLALILTSEVNGSGGDLQIASKTPYTKGRGSYTNKPFTTEYFTGKTFYYLFGDSLTTSPKPAYVELKFTSSSQMQMTEYTTNGNETKTFAWSIDNGSITKDDFTITATTLGDNLFDVVYTSDHYADYEGLLSLLTQDKALAEKIFDKWD